MNTLEKARESDIERCYAIIDAGRAFQKEQGFVQWTDDDPNIDTNRADVRDGIGYTIKVDGTIAGYMCIDFGGEPAYIDIQGHWQTEEPYAVVHRMAFANEFRGIGLADEAFRLIDALCISNGIHSIRVDTDPHNLRMQHVLEKNGFVCRGIVIFQGSGKKAYDKAL